jgi:hypothetical protein
MYMICRTTTYHACLIEGSATLIDLPDLPYPVDALEPYISARTLRTHHSIASCERVLA